MSERAYTFFDFDNTLYRGHSRYLILDFSTYLVEKDLVSKKNYQSLLKVFNDYSQNKINRHNFGIIAVDEYYRSLEGINEHVIDEIAQVFWSSIIPGCWFGFSQELTVLTDRFCRNTLISGSPAEVLSHIKSNLKISFLHASLGCIENGIYTGETRRELATQSAKQALMHNLKQIYNFDPDLCLAFGDSESDYPLLAFVSPQNAYLISEGLPSDEITLKNWNFIHPMDNLVAIVKNRLATIFTDHENLSA